MPSEIEADPPSHALDFHLKDPRFERAGNAGLQRRLQDEAWAMLEILQPGNSAMPVLSRRWMWSKDWSVILLPRDEDEESIDPRIVASLRHHHYSAVVGAAVHPAYPAPSAVWRFPPELYRRYLLAHTGGYNLVFPEDRSLAMLSDDDDMIVVGGPEAFVRDAVGGDIPAARQLFDRGPKHPERNGGPPAWYTRVMAHYAPFLLKE